MVSPTGLAGSAVLVVTAAISGWAGLRPAPKLPETGQLAVDLGKDTAETAPQLTNASLSPSGPAMLPKEQKSPLQDRRCIRLALARKQPCNCSCPKEVGASDFEVKTANTVGRQSSAVEHVAIPDAVSFLLAANPSYLWMLLLADWLIVLPIFTICCRKRSPKVQQQLETHDAESQHEGPGLEEVDTAEPLATADEEQVEEQQEKVQPLQAQPQQSVKEADVARKPGTQGDKEDAIAKAHLLLDKPEVVNDWTVFEEDGDELAYHRRRSDALRVFVQAFMISQEAGSSIFGEFDRLQEEVSQLSGEAAYWRSMAQASGVDLPDQSKAEAIVSKASSEEDLRHSSATGSEAPKEVDEDEDGDAAGAAIAGA